MNLILYIFIAVSIISATIAYWCLVTVGKRADVNMEETYKTWMNDMSQVDPKFDAERAYLESQYGLDDYQRGLRDGISNKEK